MQFEMLRAYAPSALVLAAVADARDSIDELLRMPEVFRPGAAREAFEPLLFQSEMHSNAFLEGVEVPIAAMLDEMKADSPLGMRLRSIAAVQARIAADAKTFLQTPPRILAAWQVAASAGLPDADDSRGRPRVAGELLVDPLNSGIAAADVSDSTPTLIALVTQNAAEIPPIVRAACVHLLLSLAMPFTHGNGVLARSAAHAVLIGQGTDPDQRLALMTAMTAAGRPRYVQSLRAASALTDEAVDNWVVWFCQLIAQAALQSRTIVEQVREALSAQL